ncbi:hypothetical protein OAH95_00730 [Burkholderiaceae bacterium]|nr:hypothetical protein [Burkholderiaceae bacterium]
MGKSAFPESREAVQAPEFDLIPDVLKARALWCCWKGEKRPTRVAGGRLLTGSIHIPQHWLPFDEAAHNSHTYGGWGIGMLLNGDGLVAIDIDGCVHDGEPSPESLAVMRDHGVGYVEFSPSGTGLHGYGFADLRGIKKTRFTLCGIKVEIYSHSRFMTVTGHVVWDSGITELPLLVRALQTYASEDKEDIEDMESHSSLSSASSLASMMIDGESCQLPVCCIPTGYGQRNEAIFEFARFVKGKHPTADKAMRKHYVGKWFADHESRIATKDIGDSYVDFEHAWSRVKYPYGEEWSKAKSLMGGFPVPPEVAEYGQRMCKTYQLCRALESMSPDGVFFVAMKPAGEVLGCDEATVSRHLLLLIEEEVIKIQESHVPNKKARRFEFLRPI